MSFVLQVKIKDEVFEVAKIVVSNKGNEAVLLSLNVPESPTKPYGTLQFFIKCENDEKSQTTQDRECWPRGRESLLVSNPKVDTCASLWCKVQQKARCHGLERKVYDSLRQQRYKELIEANLICSIAGLRPCLIEDVAGRPTGPVSPKQTTTTNNEEKEGSEARKGHPVYLVAKHPSTVGLYKSASKEHTKTIDTITFKTACFSFEPLDFKRAVYLRSGFTVFIKALYTNDPSKYRMAEWSEIQTFPLDTSEDDEDNKGSSDTDCGTQNTSSSGASSDSKSPRPRPRPDPRYPGLKKIWHEIDRDDRLAHAAFLHPTEAGTTLDLGAFVAFDDSFVPVAMYKVRAVTKAEQETRRQQDEPRHPATPEVGLGTRVYNVILHVSPRATFAKTKFCKINPVPGLGWSTGNPEETHPFTEITYLPSAKVQDQHLSEGGFCFYSAKLPGVVLHSCFQRVEPPSSAPSKLPTFAALTIQGLRPAAQVDKQNPAVEPTVEDLLKLDVSQQVRVDHHSPACDATCAIVMFKMEPDSILDEINGTDEQFLQVRGQTGSGDNEQQTPKGLRCAWLPTTLHQQPSQRRRAHGRLTNILNTAVRSLQYDEQSSAFEVLQEYLACICPGRHLTPKQDNYREAISLKVMDGLDTLGVHKPQKRFFTQDEVVTAKGTRISAIIKGLLRDPQVQCSLESLQQFEVCRKCQPPKSFWKSAMAKHKREAHGVVGDLSPEAAEPSGSPHEGEQNSGEQGEKYDYWLNVVMKGAKEHAQQFVMSFHQESERYSAGKDRCEEGCLCRPQRYDVQIVHIYTQ